MNRRRRARDTGRRGERGSAYVLALLALLVVSVLGLSLVYVTQTEMQIGANERTIEKTFYAAESGLAIAAARVLVAGDHRPATIELHEPGAPLGVRQRLDVAPVVPIHDAPCNLCEINNAGSYQEEAYRKVDHALTVRASRLVAGRTTASKSLAAMLELQPWRATVGAQLAASDADQLSGVRK